MKEFVLKHPIVAGLLILAGVNSVTNVANRLITVGRPIYIININRVEPAEEPGNASEITEE